MNDPTPPARVYSPRSDAAVIALFGLSGAAGLALEVSWSRQLGLLLGHTAPTISLVLTAVFVGFAIGQLVGSALVRHFNPLLAYAGCELTAAAGAAAVPSLLGWITREVNGEELDHPGVRAMACLAVLLPATIPLGATLPLIAAHITRAGSANARRVALAYGVNTLGGFLAVLATTALLAVAGVVATTYLASTASALCAFGAFALSAMSPLAPESFDRPRSLVADSQTALFAGVALSALSGFAVLGLEVLYTRMFALVFHNSTFSFGAVLATHLGALSLAAVLVSRVGTRLAPAPIALASCGLAAVVVPASVVLFVHLSGLDFFDPGGSFTRYLVGVFALVGVVVLPPVTALGMAFPALISAGGDASGQRVAWLSAVNTLAAAAGAFVAGFVCMPHIGLWSSFSLFALLLGLPVVVVLASRRRRAAACCLGATTVVGAIVVSASPTQPAAEIIGNRETIVRRWETAYGWIDVVRAEKDGSLKVRENLHYRHGSTGANATREYRQGRLPLLLHPRPTDVAFLGLGTGLTAAPVVADEAVERAVVVELIPQVVEAARLLGVANRGLLGCPKVDVRVDDARHYLARADQRFDVIVSDLFVPWESRAGYLYTADHYAAVRRALRPGGLFCQWVALYQVGPEELELIADSFASAFPTTTLWWGQFDARFAILGFVGSGRPLDLAAAQLDGRWKSLGDPPGGLDPDLSSPAALKDLYIGDWPRRPGRTLNTDEHPWLEFSAPISQRSRLTLAGPRLREYFDNVLVGLEADAARFDTHGEEAGERLRRRNAQRLSLFGGESPAQD